MHTVFENIAMYKSHTSRGFEQGTNSGLDQLADLVAELARDRK
jgi:hypothetical protein